MEEANERTAGRSVVRTFQQPRLHLKLLYPINSSRHRAYRPPGYLHQGRSGETVARAEFPADPIPDRFQGTGLFPRSLSNTQDLTP